MTNQPDTALALDDVIHGQCDARSTSEPQKITRYWIIPLGDSGTRVNNLPRVVTHGERLTLKAYVCSDVTKCFVSTSWRCSYVLISLDAVASVLSVKLRSCSLTCVCRHQITKYTHIRNFPLLETSLFVLMSYATFLAAEAAQLTGGNAVILVNMFSFV